jgi:ADP-heptose:LPS heptosyltransferase
MKNEINFQTWGGIGDVLLATPILRLVKQQWPERGIVINCLAPIHSDVFRHNPYIARTRVGIHAFLRVKVTRVPCTELHFERIPIGWAREKHATEVLAELVGVELDRRTPELYFSPEEEARAHARMRDVRNPVLLHVHSRSSRYHLWQTEKWRELIRRFPEHTFFQVGQRDEPSVPGALDWRGQVTLREAFALAKCSHAFVGVESVMGHVAAAVDVPGVVLFGDSSPVHWGHSGNINISKRLACAPCYHLLAGHDGCPYGHACMRSISVDEVEQALAQQLSRRGRAPTGLAACNRAARAAAAPHPFLSLSKPSN